MKAFDREPLAQFQRRFAIVIANVFEHRVVIRRIDDDRDRLIILRGAAHHRRSADVDLFDGLGERDAGFRDGRFERIEIYDHEIDRLKTVFPRFLFVFGISAFVEEAAMNAWMQRFHATLQDLRKIREVRNLAHGNFFFPQQLGGAAGGNDIDAAAFERSCEHGDAFLVGNGNERARDFHDRRRNVNALTATASQRSRITFFAAG